MWFLNKSTGLKWEVVEGGLCKRLSLDSNYEIIEEEQQIDYKAIHWQELRKLAIEKGINTKGLKKPDIIAELKRLKEG